MQPFVLGARGSALALRQAEIVCAGLRSASAARPVAIRAISARADEYPDRPLTAFPGEGIFVKELETALLERRIDAAVHSLKDLPLDAPGGLCLAAVLVREEPRDALVSRSGQPVRDLAAGCRVGTSSLRRRSQLLRMRPDLEMLDIRGNVDTRLRKLEEGQYDAIVLAAAGLIRLGLRERITELLGADVMLPEPGQGALALEARRDDPDTLKLLGALDHAPTRACVEAERAFLRALGGGCHLPIAALATEQAGQLDLQGSVTAPDGKRQVRGQMSGSAKDAVALGECLAKQLIAQGALDLLK